VPPDDVRRAPAGHRTLSRCAGPHRSALVALSVPSGRKRGWPCGVPRAVRRPVVQTAQRRMNTMCSGSDTKHLPCGPRRGPTAIWRPRFCPGGLSTQAQRPCRSPLVGVLWSGVVGDSQLVGWMTALTTWCWASGVRQRRRRSRCWAAPVRVCHVGLRGAIVVAHS